MPRDLKTPRATPDPSAPRPSPLDGYLRTEQEDLYLISAIYQTFATDPGRKTLEWLRMITQEAVIDPSQPDAVLRHQEGMRHLYSLIMKFHNAAR